jgi:predicted nucleic acid-binding Zn ribbon protein
MARRDDYRGNVMRCVVCATPIPSTRKWDAITCSKECTAARKNYGRSRKDQTECRYCQRPSTPEERTRYLAWRRAEKKAAKEQEATVADGDA